MLVRVCFLWRLVNMDKDVMRDCRRGYFWIFS